MCTISKYDTLSHMIVYVSPRMSRGGRANTISMTQAELAALIQEHVNGAIAANNALQQNNNNNVANPGGAGFNPYKAFMDCKPGYFSGVEGPIGLVRWIEKSESVFAMCNSTPGNRVKFAASTLTDGALTWWNDQVQTRGLDAANGMPWEDFKALIKQEYCPRDQIHQL